MRIFLTSSLPFAVATHGVAQTVAVGAADYDRARGLAAKWESIRQSFERTPPPENRQ